MVTNVEEYLSSTKVNIGLTTKLNSLFIFKFDILIQLIEINLFNFDIYYNSIIYRIYIK